MPNQINLTPIGTIHTPYKEPQGMPIQNTFNSDPDLLFRPGKAHKTSAD